MSKKKHHNMATWESLFGYIMIAVGTSISLGNVR